MRYFVAKNGSTVVEKQVLVGDDTVIDGMVDKFKIAHPLLTVSELDQTTFDVTPISKVQSQIQKDWETLKSSSPSSMQIATFFAKFLGLE